MFSYSAMFWLVFRYLGDEDDSIQSTSESRSKALLAKLQEQARARQQLQASAKQEVLYTTGVPLGTRTKRHRDEEAATNEREPKKKKRKADQPLGDESLSVETTKVEDSLPSKKKKRKEKPGEYDFT